MKFKTNNNLPCSACTNEIPKPGNRHVSANCDDCFSKSTTWESEELRDWQCGCYAVNHNKENLKGYKPLDESILKLIEVERATEKNQKAKDYYQEKLNKEYEEQIDYANEHPREKVDIFES